MKNLFSYIKKYGSFSFMALPFNEVDGLILSAFSYLELDDILKNSNYIIQDIYKLYKGKEIKNLWFKKQNKLIRALSKSKRFASILVSDYFKKIDTKKDIQITSMTFNIENNFKFIAFRGTEKLVGWKEDFELSYKITASQEKALYYVNHIINKYKSNVLLGGHSKGGNLAMYAGLFCKYSDNIVQIYNYDGPGFFKDIVNSSNYQNNKNKIRTFIPKSSIVGKILNNETKTLIIESKNKGILQHDLYSWIITDNHLTYLKNLDKEEIKKIIELNDYINKIPDNKKKEIISSIFNLLEKGNFDELEEKIKKISILSMIKNKEISVECLVYLKNVFSYLEKIILK